MANDKQHSIDMVRLCTCFNVRLAARAITQFYNDALAPSDLLSTQFSLLVALKWTNPLSINELASVLGLDRTTLARNLRPLDKRGLVTIQSHKSDARIKEVWLTSHGDKALEAALPLWKNAQDQIEQYLGETQIPKIHDYLWKIAQIESE